MLGMGANVPRRFHARRRVPLLGYADAAYILTCFAIMHSLDCDYDVCVVAARGEGVSGGGNGDRVRVQAKIGGTLAATAVRVGGEIGIARRSIPLSAFK
jgi:hypothetical protein